MCARLSSSCLCSAHARPCVPCRRPDGAHPRMGPHGRRLLMRAGARDWHSGKSAAWVLCFFPCRVLWARLRRDTAAHRARCAPRPHVGAGAVPHGGAGRVHDRSRQQQRHLLRVAHDARWATCGALRCPARAGRPCLTCAILSQVHWCPARKGPYFAKGLTLTWSVPHAGASMTTHFEPLHKLKAHTNIILKCLISPDCQQLATTSADKTGARPCCEPSHSLPVERSRAACCMHPCVPPALVAALVRAPRRDGLLVDDLRPPYPTSQAVEPGRLHAGPHAGGPHALGVGLRLLRGRRLPGHRLVGHHRAPVGPVLGCAQHAGASARGTCLWHAC
jgi:hypothetical protein